MEEEEGTNPTSLEARDLHAPPLLNVSTGYHRLFAQLLPPLIFLFLFYMGVDVAMVRATEALTNAPQSQRQRGSGLRVSFEVRDWVGVMVMFWGVLK